MVVLANARKSLKIRRPGRSDNNGSYTSHRWRAIEEVTGTIRLGLLNRLRDTSVLQELMRELAFILLARGMTPRDFSELSRLAFVQAAAARSKLRNGRVNHSRVAAQTGLTRADVKRLLDRSTLTIVSREQPQFHS